MERDDYIAAKQRSQQRIKALRDKYTQLQQQEGEDFVSNTLMRMEVLASHLADIALYLSAQSPIMELWKWDIFDELLVCAGILMEKQQSGNFQQDWQALLARFAESLGLLTSWSEIVGTPRILLRFYTLRLSLSGDGIAT